jgi:hypothetical protein
LCRVMLALLRFAVRSSFAKVLIEARKASADVVAIGDQGLE